MQVWHRTITFSCSKLLVRNNRQRTYRSLSGQLPAEPIVVFAILGGPRALHGRHGNASTWPTRGGNEKRRVTPVTRFSHAHAR